MNGTTFTALLASYHQARETWHAHQPNGELEPEGPEYEAYAEAEAAIFEYPCHTIEEIKAKTTAILSDQTLREMLSNCWVGEDYASVVLLKSFVFEGAAA